MRKKRDKQLTHEEVVQLEMRPDERLILSVVDQVSRVRRDILSILAGIVVI